MPHYFLETIGQEGESNQWIVGMQERLSKDERITYVNDGSDEVVFQAELSAYLQEFFEVIDGCACDAVVRVQAGEWRQAIINLLEEGRAFMHKRMNDGEPEILKFDLADEAWDAAAEALEQISAVADVNKVELQVSELLHTSCNLITQGMRKALEEAILLN